VCVCMLFARKTGENVRGPRAERRVSILVFDARSSGYKRVLRVRHNGISCCTGVNYDGTIETYRIYFMSTLIKPCRKSNTVGHHAFIRCAYVIQTHMGDTIRFERSTTIIPSLISASPSGYVFKHFQGYFPFNRDLGSNISVSHDDG